MKTITTIPVIAVFLSGVVQASAADAITNAPAEKKLVWDTSASAGLTITRGNSESTLASAGIKAATKWDQNELKLGADGLYGKSKIDGTETKSAESLGGYGQYNRLFTEHWYGYFRLEGLHDGVADIKYRLTVSPGVGYYFIKNPATELNAEAGPGFIYEKVGSETKSYMTLRLAENYKHSFNENVRVWEKAELLPQIDDFQNYILNVEVGLEASLSKKLSFQSKIIDNYDNRPAPGRKCNDVKWINGLSYKF